MSSGYENNSKKIIKKSNFFIKYTRQAICNVSVTPRHIHTHTHTHTNSLKQDRKMLNCRDSKSRFLL